MSAILYEQEQYSEMHPALDISNDCLYVAVQVNTSEGAKLYLLKSKGDGTVEATPYDQASLPGRVLKTQGLDLSHATPPIRWLGAGLRKVINDHTVEVPNFPDVYKAVRDTLSSYLVADEQHITITALFVLLTYFHPLMDHLPVLWCRAVQGAGKSRLAESVGFLSLNGMVSGTSTRSTIFRDADAGRYTQALTEMDRLAGTATGDELATDFHGCTDPAEAWVVVAEKMTENGKHKPARYYGYTPRILCTTTDIKSAPLRSRTIRLDLQPVANPDFDKLDRRLDGANTDLCDVRDLLYRLLLGAWPKVKDAYQAAKQSWRDETAPRGRTRDKWLPLYTMAQLAKDDSAVAVVKQMAANDPNDTRKSRADSLDAYLLLFAAWLVHQSPGTLGSATYTEFQRLSHEQQNRRAFSSTEIWKDFTNTALELQRGTDPTPLWAQQVGLSIGREYLKRSAAGGPTKLMRELERLHVCTQGTGRERRGYVFDRDATINKVRATLGDDVVEDCGWNRTRLRILDDETA